MSADDPQTSPARLAIDGNPTADEIAAVVTVLAALTSGKPDATVPPAPATGNGWAARWRGMRSPLTPGPDAWRLSTRA